MNHLINILTGLGSALGGFGASRPYSVPRRGDRSKDARNIARDFHGVEVRLYNNSCKALENKEYGAVEKRTAKTR
ncbi:MAG: hypothetical protein ACN6OP_23680 [Pseudomonadales bacterium]